VSDIARRVAAVAIGTGTLLFALRVVTGNPVALSFVFALGVMVALVPEGLPATLSVSLAIGVRLVPLHDGLRALIGDANDVMAAQALPVLAVARKTVGSARAAQEEAERNLTFLGLVGMSDPPRPEVTAAVEAWRRAGITIYMVTGDYGLTAEAIARRVGITGEGPARLVSGADLDAMDD